MHSRLFRKDQKLHKLRQKVSQQTELIQALKQKEETLQHNIKLQMEEMTDNYQRNICKLSKRVKKREQLLLSVAEELQDHISREQQQRQQQRQQKQQQRQQG